MRYAPLLILAGLAGCGTTPAQQSQLIAAGQTLAAVAAGNNTTVAAVVKSGSLFCQQVIAGQPLVVALANLYGAPVSVTNQAAADVATACALVDGIPVAPPADPAAAVVVVAPVAVLPAA